MLVLMTGSGGCSPSWQVESLFSLACSHPALDTAGAVLSPLASLAPGHMALASGILSRTGSGSRL